ncbi:hypothetical protein [Paenibacillus sp. OSY-SE]|uniref:hypothetical protein n=1 Tax=Paenibacillus sp. OSY-SE TaxID=1196323 RepID=UPI00031DB7F0|nr:hypothetical protein [Paenibacillus sp. OSY-SE]
MYNGKEHGGVEGALFANLDDTNHITVADPYLIDIVQSLMNLTEAWKDKVKGGSIKLQFAVQIGSKLDADRQERLMEFVQETPVPEKDMGKVLHAYAMEMPEWSIRHILRIYRLAERTKAALIMFNDLMERLEQVIRQFEFDFWDGNLPREEDRLESVLDDVHHKLTALAEHAPRREKKAYNYNGSYGDSSSNSWEHQEERGGVSFHALIGVPDEADAKQVRKQSKKLLKLLHPDHGGSAYLFDWVKKAYDVYNGNGHKE